MLIGFSQMQVNHLDENLWFLSSVANLKIEHIAQYEGNWSYLPTTFFFVVLH